MCLCIVMQVNKNECYLQDTGACMAVLHVRVYYMYCPSVVKNLASFPRTTSGGEVTSLVEARGTCVPFAVEVKKIFVISLKIFCYSLFSLSELVYS